MSKLLIVESPAKAKTISKYLDGKYKVVASVGHIRDLPKSNKKAIDIEKGFVPHYEISKGKEKVVSEIKELAKKASEVLLATDPDREGESIAWHIKEAIGIKNPKRVVFHEITKEAVTEAVLNPRKIDMNLKEAQEARRVLDRLVGYDLSGVIWKKVRYGLSAGRVQSPALRIIMEREREIRNFKSHTYWVINAKVNSLKNKNDDSGFVVICEKEPTTEKELNEIIETAKKAEKNKTWVIKDVKETGVKRAPRPPFITSTLQQTASSRLGFSPSRTMSIAQKLYEAGLITYMRTDSTNLSNLALGEITKVVDEKYGKNYLQIRKYSAKSKNAQEAHEAIRPTHFNVLNAGHNDEQKKLYELIWRRAVSSQMVDADTLRTKIIANTENDELPNFSITGTRVISPGWLLADPQSKGEEVELPQVNKKDKLKMLEINSEEKQTEPPGRYSEAGLIKELEKRGIGRPSTYASIIKTLEDRGYVEKINKALVPTDTGDVVSSFLEQNFPTYISDDFTAHMEDDLDLIAEGKKEYIKTLTDFYKPFQKEVKSKDKMDKVTTMGDADSKFKCPTCGSSMIIKLGRSGKFLSCSRYPDCEGALTIDGQEIKKDEPIGIDPETKLPIFVLIGKYGPYVQLGERVKGKGSKKAPKPRMASIPKDKDLSTVTLKDALKYLSLPKVLGLHPETNEEIIANIGRFGPYIALNSKPKPDFRSLKTDDVYTIDLKRALEILKEEKKSRFKKKKDNK